MERKDKRLEKQQKIKADNERLNKLIMRKKLKRNLKNIESVAVVDNGFRERGQGVGRGGNFQPMRFPLPQVNMEQRYEGQGGYSGEQRMGHGQYRGREERDRQYRGDERRQ